MFRHFLKIFYRTSFRSGGYSLINVSGLTVGLASSILMFLWVADELSFDSFHRDPDRIFQVMGHHDFDVNIFTYPQTPGPLAEALRELPEVETSLQTVITGRTILNVRDRAFFEEGIYSQKEIFDVFNFPLVEGDAKNPLPDNNSIAISEALALKYFRGEEAIGQVMKINNKLDATVTAIFADIPANASLRFEFVLPYSLYARSDQYNGEWGAWTGGSTYVKLTDGASATEVEEKIAALYTKPRIWVRWDDNVELVLFPLKDWHLRANFENGKQTGGRIVYVRLFGIVALFILLIACVNFMNLATARSLSRSREVAVRKVVGAARGSLIGQFIFESILISLASLAIAVALVYLLLPAFSDLTGRKTSLDLTNPVVAAALLGVALLAGVIAGSYPAFVLSSFRALNILKGVFSGSGHAALRKALVVFQFSISVVLVICALVVSNQIEYMRNKDLGFDKHNVFYVGLNDALRKDFDAIKQEALQHPEIEYVAQANTNPMEVFSEIVFPDDAWPGKTSGDNIAFKWMQVDHDFLPALGFTLIRGRYFSHDFPADTANYIITEGAVRRMKLTDPIGVTLNSPRKGQIIGVVKDFHSSSLQGEISPAVISMWLKKNTDRIFIRYREGSAGEALNLIKQLLHKVDPASPFEYTFLDDTFDSQYRQEIMTAKLARYFTFIAIFISCLGLFGLAAFTAAKRTKEIGVRKVLGASVSQMIVLLCRDFVLLAGIALLVGIPIGWLAVRRFLDGYAFHTDIGVSVFLITGAWMISLALLTVCVQSARAALINPADSLRTE